MSETQNGSETFRDEHRRHSSSGTYTSEDTPFSDRSGSTQRSCQRVRYLVPSDGFIPALQRCFLHTAKTSERERGAFLEEGFGFPNRRVRIPSGTQHVSQRRPFLDSRNCSSRRPLEFVETSFRTTDSLTFRVRRKCENVVPTPASPGAVTLEALELKLGFCGV